MKLYIPTCTLNFNNIFTTESISPKSFYFKRGFGNKRFYSVEPNNFEDVILLYSKYPKFDVDDKEMENYPMVIEVESEDYPSDLFSKAFSHMDVDIYMSSSTVYLNPFHSFVYFESFAERQGVLTKAAQSLENKFEKLYNSNLIVKVHTKKNWVEKTKDLFLGDDNGEFNWDSSYLPKELSVESVDLESEKLIDRIKGFMYCYLIGANMTVSPEVAELKTIARRMRNTLSAIVNSPTHTPNNLQDDSLTNDIRQFNQIFATLDDDVIYNINLINTRIGNDPSGLSKEAIIDLLERLGVYNDFCSKLHLRRVYDANNLWNCIEFYSPDAYNAASEALTSAVKKVEVRNLSKIAKSYIGNLIRVEENKTIHVIDSNLKADFYDNLINSQLADDYEKFMLDNGVEESLAIAFTGGKILKQILGDKWENSKWSAYINSLLSHLQESKAFDLYAVENEVLNSFAAFCQKGDNIDRLSEYLLQCGINNYRIAFGLYGATRGFASLPKTFTSSLINGERDYYKAFVIELYKQLFGVTINNAEFPIQSRDCQIHESIIGSTIMENINHIEPKKQRQSKVISAVDQAIFLEDAVQSPKAFMYIADNIIGKSTNVYKALKNAHFEDDEHNYTLDSFKDKIYSIIESSLPKAKSQRKETIEKINMIIQLEAKRQDATAFLYILDNLLKPTDAAYKRIVELLNKPEDATGQQVAPKSNMTPSQSLKPINKISELFVDDDNACNYILTRTYIPHDIRILLSKKICSFQKDYAIGGYYYGRDDSPRSNDNTIKHFINKCTYQNGKNSSWVQPSSENRILLERLKNDLMERYANR